MTASEQVLQSIEQRLRQLHQEIAALESARARLSTDAEAAVGPRAGPVRPPGGRAARKPGRPAAGTDSNGVGELTEEQWVARRAAELAAQRRQGTAAG